ncbi:MAG: PKD domain-containing protein [Bacteroidales bacterium]|nr:PKD domain-containing protein [Bacteroidales bacterium]
MKIPSIILLLCLFFIPVQSYSQCNYLAYEGFDYPVTSPLNAKTGGTGWKNSWDVITGFTGGFLTSSTTGSLSYLDLKTSGNYATGGYEWYSMGRRLSTSPGGPFDAWVEPWEDGIGTRKTATTIYMSTILGKKNNDANEAYFDLHENELPWYNYSDNLKRIGVGYFGAVSEVGGQKRWSLRIDNTLYDTGVPVVIGTPSFFVVKLEFGVSYTTVSVYVNPSTLGGTNTVAPTIVQNAPNRHCVRSVGVYLGSSPTNGVIDEIRFGTSFECVAPNASSSVNLPPVASFTTSVTSGKIPLPVTLDASSSLDPEGKSLTYSWNFGDGTPNDSGVVVNHTYSGLLGTINATLTVIDDLGTKNSIIHPITLTDENNTFPCLTSIEVLKMASCGNSDAAIKVYVPTTSTIDLKNSNGVSMPKAMSNSTEFRNLAPGVYDLYVTGANSCSDYRKLYIVTDSTTCDGWRAAKSKMRIGTNLTSFSDWTKERAMKNLFKHTRVEYVPYLPSNNSIWSVDYPVNHYTTAQMTFDADGYPTFLPQNTSSGATGLRYMLSTSEANLLVGKDYVFKYDGEGTFAFQGCSITNSAPGRIVFRCVSGSVNFAMSYSKAGNNVRNIRLLRIEDEFADLNANPFSKEFLDRIEPFAGLRFMEWTNTNGSPLEHWNQRGTENLWTYSGARGVPYEVMIKLANLTKKDVWVCVPHLADDDYVTQMATLFRDQLNPGLKVYLEYSNELWNWTFSQSLWNSANKPYNLSFGRAAAEKAKHVFQIWHSVFGSEKGRVQRLLGLQGGYTELSEDIMSQLSNDDWDLASTSFYYSLDHADVGALANPVLDASSTAADIIANSRNKWNRDKPMQKRLFNCAKLYGKSIIGYEGGQHFVGTVIGGTNYPYQEKMYDAQTCPEMYQLYSDVLADLRDNGCVLAMNYSLAGDQRSMYGSWGALADISMTPPFNVTAPKYQALLDNIVPNSAIVDAIDSRKLNENFIEVYPNPTRNDLTVKLANQEDFMKLEMFDSTGRFLLQTDKNTVSLKTYQDGIYFVKVSTSSGFRIKRIVKIK